MKKVLLVGGGGFVGGHLAAELIRRGHSVQSADLPVVAERNSSILPLDLSRSETIHAVLKQVQPDVIFHLAAQSMVPKSWEEPAVTCNTNITGSVNLLMETIRTVSSARFIFIGSGEEYGVGCDLDHPFSEEGVCNPQNPYAVSKFSAGMLLEQVASRNQVDFIHLRPFNHYGPGQREGFAVSDFCAQIARIESGNQTPLMRIGCLEAQRDLSFVSDIIRGYVTMAEIPEHRHITYNLCSGIPRKMQEILDTLLSFSKVSIRTEIDPARYRKPENPVLFASHDRITEETAWKPEIELKDGLLQTLNFWRSKIQ